MVTSALRQIRRDNGGEMYKNKLWFIIGLVVVLLFTGCANQKNVDNQTNDDGELEFLSSLEETVVTRVVDGDTIVIESGEKVRFILVNCPESVHSDSSKNTEFGAIASAYTKSILEGETIYLEKDVSNIDRYGRLLRYIYLADGTFFNEQLVKEGYAQLSTFPPDVKYKDIILDAEQYARNNNLGLWSNDSSEKMIYDGQYVGSKNSDKYHYPNCKHVQSIAEKNLIYFDSIEEAREQGYVPGGYCQPE